MRLVYEPHGVGKGVVPGPLVVDRVALWITGRQRLDQRAFRGGDAADQREGSAGRVIGAGERRGLTGGVLQFPGVVVVWPDRVRDTPMRHGTVRVRLQRLLEAGDSFLMVVAKAPVEATLEPTLGIRRAGGHLPGVRPEIIGVVHIASLSIPGKVGPRPKLFACRAQPRSAGRNVAKSLPRKGRGCWTPSRKDQPACANKPLCLNRFARCKGSGNSVRGIFPVIRLQEV